MSLALRLGNLPSQVTKTACEAVLNINKNKQKYAKIKEQLYGNREIYGKYNKMNGIIYRMVGQSASAVFAICADG